MNNNNFDPMTGQPINQQVQQPVQPQMNTGYTQQSTQSTPTKKENKKIILLILSIVAIIGIVMFGWFRFFGNNNATADLNAIFDPNKPIIVKNNGKYGYITSEGETMIEPQYKEAYDFHGDYAVVWVDNPDTNAYNKQIYQIIDKKGNVKLTSNNYFSPKYYSTYDVWIIDGVLYDSKLNKVLSEGITVKYINYGYFEYIDSVKKESGIITYKGKKIFTIPGTSVSVDISKNNYDETELYADVSTYIEPKKRIVISLKTGDILFTAEDAESYYIKAEENGIFYYYNHELEDGYKNKKYLFFINNKLAYQTTEVVNEVEVYNYQNQILEIDYGYDYESLGKSQRRYYYDVKHKKMLEKSPSTTDLKLDSTERIYGFKKYSSSEKYGLMSGEKVIVPCKYDDIKYLDINIFNYMKSKGKELVLLKEDKNIFLYNLKNSKTITAFNSGYIDDYDDSTFIKFRSYEKDEYTTKSYTIYNMLSDKSMNFDKNNNILIESNYITVEKDGKKTYYNTNFKQIYVARE